MSLPLHRSSVASCCVLFEAGVSSGCVICSAVTADDASVSTVHRC